MATAASASIAQFYAGKNVFITGGTGFVGKVLIEKLLRSFPDIGKLYVLIRQKKGQAVQQRLEDEIFSSNVWLRLKREGPHANLVAFLRRKVVPIPGDLQSDGLGLSPDSVKLLSDNVDIVMHCAASVRFNEPLDRAIDMNTLGALRLFSLASKWRRLVSYVHVSTAYVNANKKEFKIEEKVYPLDFDAVDVLRRLPTMSEQDIQRETMRIMGEFPNTYTLTKAMAETILEQRRGRVPLTILRPSIIGASWREPSPGWVDCISAAGAVFVASALGVLTVMPGNSRGIADIVPVDFVVNHIIASAYLNAGRDMLSVTHSSTGDSGNELHWRVPIEVLPRYFVERPLSKRFGNSKFAFVRSHQLFQLNWFFRYSVPSSVLSTYANAVGTASQRKLAANLHKLVWKASTVVELFKPFTCNQWLFKTDSLRDTIQALSPEEQKLLPMDAREVDWVVYCRSFGFGLSRWVMKEDMVELSENEMLNTSLKLTTERLLEWDPDHHKISFPGLLSDIVWVYTTSRAPGYTKSGVLGRLLGVTGWTEGKAHEAKHIPRPPLRSPAELRAAVLNDPAVLQEVAALCASGKITESAALQACDDMLARIESRLDSRSQRSLAWALRKVMRQIYERISVDEPGLERVRQLLLKKDAPVLFLPTHRSYMDFLLLSYICFAYNIPVPFIAAGEDFLHISFISKMLRQSGAFFIRRSFRSDPLYGVVLKSYMQQLLLDKQPMEFFIEGTRSRSGKMLPPRLGLLSAAMEPILDGRLKDVYLVPLSIDYERPLETVLYSEEVLGKPKKKESIGNLLKARSVLRSNFGCISVSFSEPQSARDLLREFYGTAKASVPRGVAKQQHAEEKSNDSTAIRNEVPRSILKSMSLKLLSAMHSVSTIMPTHLVATLLLMYRQGIRASNLEKRTGWLMHEITSRGGRVSGIEGERLSTVVTRALSLLDGLAKKQEGRDVYECNPTGRGEYWRMIALGYYRNKLMHVFVEEAMWCASVYAAMHHGVSSFPPGAWPGHQDAGAVQGQDVIPQVSGSFTPEVRLQDVVRYVQLLEELFSREFPNYKPGGSAVAMSRALDRCIEHKALKRSKRGSQEFLRVNDEGEELFSLLCGIIWPLIDSYWVSIVTLAALPAPRSEGKSTSVDDGCFVPVQSLLDRTQWAAETLYHNKNICFYESCSLETLGNALQRLKEYGIVEFRSLPSKDAHQGGKAPAVNQVSLSLKYTHRGKLAGFASQVAWFRKPAPVALSGNPFTSNVSAELPMLSSFNQQIIRGSARLQSARLPTEGESSEQLVFKC